MDTMKKFTYIIAGLFLLTAAVNVNAQLDQQGCTVEYNLFKGDVQGKNFATAKTRLDELMTNCPTLSVNIYKLGSKISDNMIANGDKVAGVALQNKVNQERIKHFPKDLGKVYSDWFSFCVENGSSEESCFHYLEKGYKADPSGMSAKNIYLYFDVVLEQNKNSNVQKILDTYDDINDALEDKSGKYQQKLSKLLAKEDAGKVLGKKEAKSKRIAEAVLRNIGIISGGLEQKVEELLTCERLVPIYKRDFETNKTNAQWLKRAVSRMFHKGCKEDPLYEQLAKNYASASPSADAYIFVAGILEKQGKTSEALEMRKKAFGLETDPIRKARFLLNTAQDFASKGQKGQARKYAYEALTYNPSLGKAYLLIASMYASSANSCGNDEFSKRMVYVAALNKAVKAAVVDPSISSRARRYIKSYSSNTPTTSMAFAKGVKSGESFRVGCWIGETVTVKLR